ncbi:39S ribosomal protein L30, mitochondrial [Branchiostoma belcheri]|nr:39S ribosomal protein L30, mitochondrial [Branchiostoma belcheri]
MFNISSDHLRFNHSSDPLRFNHSSDPLRFHNISDPILFNNTSDPILFNNISNPLWFNNISDPLLFNNISDPLLFNNISDPLLFNNISDPLLFNNISDPLLFNNISDPLLFNNISDPLLFNNSSDPLLFNNISDPLLFNNSSDPLLFNNISDPLLFNNSSDPLWFNNSSDPLRFDNMLQCYTWHLLHTNMSKRQAIETCPIFDDVFASNGWPVYTFGVMGVFIILANVMVLFGIIGTRKLHKALYLYIANLAISDLLPGILLICLAFGHVFVRIKRRQKTRPRQFRGGGNRWAEGRENQGRAGNSEGHDAQDEAQRKLDSSAKKARSVMILVTLAFVCWLLGFAALPFGHACLQNRDVCSVRTFTTYLGQTPTWSRQRR